MSIRRRIFRSYLILIIIVLVYLTLSFFLNGFRLRLERDRNEILEVNAVWGDMLVFMNESVSNWNSGATYQKFIDNSLLFDRRLSELTDAHGPAFWYRKETIRYLDNLETIWKLAQVNIERIEETRRSSNFLTVEEFLNQEPGLQRLYQVYMRLLDSDTIDDSRYAFALKEYIDTVEFFPIYSDTVNYLFSVILENMESNYERLLLIQNYVSVLFFIIFLVSFILISTHFTESLSRPITALSNKLSGFIGKSVEPITKTTPNELELLEHAVDDLIVHYTHLSELAGRLANGHIETSLLRLPRQGVVGNALKDVAAYMKQLAQVADWIREGQYGSVIVEKSEQDVLARSFNIMSREIASRITTLTNIFETIDEGILLIDSQGKTIEANQKIVNLLDVEDLSQLEEDDILDRFIHDGESLRNLILEGSPISDLYCDLYSARFELIPVRINVRPLTKAAGERGDFLVLVSNESLRIRMRREQERLAAQATEAELRALRAQINPHFLFNTLNTIAHLIETEPEEAVGTVEKLAGMFRYALLSTKHPTVALSEEMLHVRTLLEIEKIRHGKRLEVNLNLGRGTEERPIPPMVLQPLVENGIKHGADPEGNIRLTISSALVDKKLIIEVADRGTAGIDIDRLLNNSRTGLKNVNQRLLTLYRSSLEFEQYEPRGLLVRIKIPLEGEAV